MPRRYVNQAVGEVYSPVAIHTGPSHVTETADHWGCILDSGQCREASRPCCTSDFKAMATSLTMSATERRQFLLEERVSGGALA